MVLIVAKCIVNLSDYSYRLVCLMVLIVAKCIVNFLDFPDFEVFPLRINSSKVYCKCLLIMMKNIQKMVLIVAKCIVNYM